MAPSAHPEDEQPAAPVPAEAEAHPASWQKSHASADGGGCVEMAKLPGGEIVVRNSRQPGGPALIYTRAEIATSISAIGRFRSSTASRSGCVRILSGFRRSAWM